MADHSTDSGVTEAEAQAGIQSGLRRQMGQMLQALYTSPVARILMWLSIGIVIVVGATAYAQIRLNRWNKPFYDAISRRDFGDFLTQLGVFLIIAGGLLVLNVAQRWLVETLKLRLREGLVEDLAAHWMKPLRAFWLAHSGPMGVNPDQRMHDDTRKLCELSADLGVGLLQATILFLCFSGVLWGLSSGFIFHLGGKDYAIPGYMLWAAILYSGTGSILSYWVGRNLISRNAERYAREADLRYTLVRTNEHLDGISLASGEADERRRIRMDLAGVLEATRLLVLSLTNLTWVTASFGWITNVVPILAAAPLYFTGKISFGGLVMAAAAFTQTEVALRWFVDNFSTIADWRATLLRVASFRQALVDSEAAQPDQENRITYAEGEPDRLVIEDLEIESSAGRDMLEERRLVVHAGERILIVGAPGTGTAPLFRALAGLWPWGAGRITRPRDQQILYVPRGTPYLPRGPLRAVMAYPSEPDIFHELAYAHALQRLGLERLIPLLDVARRWDRELSQDEQLSLTFARVVLQAPPWVLIDDAFGALDEDTIERFVDALSDELSHSSIIHIGRAVEGRDPLFSRVLHLVKAPIPTTVEVETTDGTASPDDTTRDPQ